MRGGATPEVAQFGSSSGLPKNLRNLRVMALVPGTFEGIFAPTPSSVGAEVSQQDNGDCTEPALELAVGGHVLSARNRLLTGPRLTVSDYSLEPA